MKPAKLDDDFAGPEIAARRHGDEPAPGKPLAAKALLARPAELKGRAALAVTGAGKAIAELLSSPHAAGLRALALHDVKSGTFSAILGALDDAPFQLDALDVWIDGDADVAATALAGCAALGKLRRLGFHSTLPACGTPFHQGPAGSPPVHGQGVLALARSPALRRLESLTLANLDDAEGARALVEADWPELRTLRILDIDEKAGPILCAGDLIGRLERLQVHYLGARGLSALTANAGAKALRVLSAGGLLQRSEPIGDAEFAALAASPHLQGLVVLQSAWWKLGAPSYRALQDGSLPKLRALDLMNDSSDRAAFQALGQVTGLAALDSLIVTFESTVLRGPDLRASLDAFLAGPLAARVSRLALHGVNGERGDEVVAALAAAQPLPRLRVLAVGGSNLPSCGNDGAKALVGATNLPALELVYLRARDAGTGISKGNLTALGKRFTVSPASFALWRELWS